MKKIISFILILLLTLCLGSICFAGLSQPDLMWEYVKYAGGTPPSEHVFTSSELGILNSNRLVIYKGYKSNSDDECLFFRSPTSTWITFSSNSFILGAYNEYYLCFNLTSNNYEGYLYGYTVYDKYSLHDSSVMTLDEFGSDNYMRPLIEKSTLYTDFNFKLNGSSLDDFVKAGYNVLDYPSFVSSSSGHVCNYTEAFLCLKNNNNTDMSDFYIILDKYNNSGDLLQSIELNQSSNSDDMWLTIDNITYTANLGDMISPDTSEDVYYKARVKSYSLEFYEVESNIFDFYHNCAEIVSSSSGYVSNTTETFLCINVSETQDFKDFYLILEIYRDSDNNLLESFELKDDNMWLTLDGETYTANVGEIYDFDSSKEYYYRLKLKSYLHPYFEDTSPTFYFDGISNIPDPGEGESSGDTGNIGGITSEPCFLNAPSGLIETDLGFEVDVISNTNLDVSNYYLAFTQYSSDFSPEFSQMIRDNTLWQNKENSQYSINLKDFYDFSGDKYFKVFLIKTSSGIIDSSAYFYTDPALIIPDDFDTNDRDEEEIKGGIAGIWQAITNLPKLIGDAIAGIFIPADGFFSDYFSELNDWFSERLGILYFPFDFIVDFFSRIYTSEFKDPTIVIPAMQIPLFEEYGNIYDGTTFNFKEFINQHETFMYIYNLYLIAVDGIVIFGLIRLLMKKYEEVTTNGN